MSGNSRPAPLLSCDHLRGHFPLPRRLERVKNGSPWGRQHHRLSPRWPP